MISIDGFNNDNVFDRKDVIFDPSPFLLNILDGDSNPEQEIGQFSHTAWSVTNGTRELDQSAVGCHTTVQASSKDSGINVTTTKSNHHPVAINSSKNHQKFVRVVKESSKSCQRIVKAKAVKLKSSQ